MGNKSSRKQRRTSVFDEAAKHRRKSSDQESKPARLPKKEVALIKRQVSFSEEEIQDWYHEFCRRSATSNTKDLFLTEAEFADVYNSVFLSGDGSEFARHIFRTFDRDGKGKIDFREFVIGLSNSSSEESEILVPWAFKVYDVRNTGFIVKEEMTEVIRAVFQLMGLKRVKLNEMLKTPEELAEDIFENMDKNHDGQISWQEFQDGAMDNNALAIKLLQCCPPEDNNDDAGNTPDLLVTGPAPSDAEITHDLLNMRPAPSDSENAHDLLNMRPAPSDSENAQDLRVTTLLAAPSDAENTHNLLLTSPGPSD